MIDDKRFKNKRMKLILILFFLLQLSFVGICQDEPLIPEYIPTEGLVGWWPFNANADDESGNGNFGTVNRAKLCEDRFEKKSKAYQFDGIYSYIAVELHNQSLLLDNNFTISFWTKLNFNNNNDQTFISKGDGFSNEYSIFCSQEYEIEFIDHGKMLQPNFKFQGFNSWTNIVCTMDHGIGSIYIDGSLVYNITTAKVILPSNLPLVFGATFEPGTNTPIRNSYLNGKLDDVGIWNRVLTKDEILKLAKADF
jgi:hypothetical protein